MKPINRIFLFLLFISVSYAISYAQENQSYFLHTIEKGQSLYSISKMRSEEHTSELQSQR